MSDTLPEIRRCQAQEAEEVMAFIDAHWKKGHVLAVDRRLFEWQYRAADGGYNLLIARLDGQLLGVLGYVPTDRYDPALGADSLTWLALWKVRDDCGQPGLGLRMLQALARQQAGGAGLGVNGINPAHPPLYKALRYQVATLGQYFMIHPLRQAPLIGRPANVALPLPRGGGATVSPLSCADLEDMSWPWVDEALPRKTPAYFAHRFLHHPFYHYMVHAVAGPQGLRALIASRVAAHGEHRVLRVVDFMGDAGVIAHMGHAFLALMDEHEVGHVDFWQHGLPDELMRACGFGCAQDMPDVCVPNFYEPFHAATGRLQSAFKVADADRMRVFRADGDQDRPNQPTDPRSDHAVDQAAAHPGHQEARA